MMILHVTSGLPVQVRDQILEEAGGAAGITAMTVPQSDTNKQWFAGQHDRMVRRSARVIVTAVVFFSPHTHTQTHTNSLTPVLSPMKHKPTNAQQTRWRRATRSRTARRR